MTTPMVPMPRLLKIGLLIVRLLPGLTMLILAVALLGTDQSSSYVRWLGTAYGIQAKPAGVFLAASAVAAFGGALVWIERAGCARRTRSNGAVGPGRARSGPRSSCWT